MEELEDNQEEIVKKYNDFYITNSFNVNPTVWKQDSHYIRNSFDTNFRGENAFVWQEQLGDNKQTYIEYYKIIKSIDTDNLLHKTREYGLYGCKSYEFDNIRISRDLLDSILEIYFMKSFFSNLNELSLLEIGGGYGRLCKRYLDCFPASQYHITDAIPQSTLCSKVYLNEHTNSVINLYDVPDKMKSLKVDVAVNIHSFPECNINDIEWWIKLIHSNRIKYVFYVPNNPKSTAEFMPSNTGESILDLFTKYNYTVKYHKNMYSDLNIKYSYSVPFFIFEHDTYTSGIQSRLP
jgi:putative sugar O-methyltransferase